MVSGRQPSVADRSAACAERLFPGRIRPIVLSGFACGLDLLGWWHPWASLTLIDVGQGDSILIRLPYNQGNILIDTGKARGAGCRERDASGRRDPAAGRFDLNPPGR